MFGVKGTGLSDSAIHLSYVAFSSLLSPPWPPLVLPVLPAASRDSVVQCRALFPAIGQARQAVVFLASVSASVIKVNTFLPVFVGEASEGRTETLLAI